MNRRILSLLGLMLLAPSLYAEEPVMFDKTQTYCFGRYLVDIPIGAVQKGQRNTYLGSTIEIERMGPEVLRQHIDRRIVALKEGKAAAEYFGFKQQIKVSEHASLLLGYLVAYGDPMYSIDSFKWDRGWAFMTSHSPYDDKTIDSLVGRFSTYLRNIRYRSPREIPSEPGFCLENGFIANDGTHPQAEVASLAFRLKDNQDVRIRIESEVRFKPWPSLLTKQKQANLQGRFPGMIKIIKSGQLTVNGLVGEESLMSYPSDDKVGEAHNFTWETLGEEGRTLKPDILLEITSGEGVAGVTGQSTISTKQILALYEGIVKSIRLRPSDVSK